LGPEWRYGFPAWDIAHAKAVVLPSARAADVCDGDGEFDGVADGEADEDVGEGVEGVVFPAASTATTCQGTDVPSTASWAIR
jgi:hypothetical protein